MGNKQLYKKKKSRKRQLIRFQKTMELTKRRKLDILTAEQNTTSSDYIELQMVKESPILSTADTQSNDKMVVIYMRMLGYSATLVMHGANLLFTNSLIEGPVMDDPDIRTFTGLYKRFFTVWTMFLQIFVATMGLTSDYLTLKYSNKQEPWLLGVLKGVKNKIFAAILWPTAFLVSTMFWSLYHYDRSLIYPLFADKLLTTTSNHIMHTAIIPLVFWEVLFQPRSVPKSHGVNVTMLTVYMLTYLSVMYYTYIDQGVWMYPIFGLAYKKHICFPLSIATIGVALYIYYHMQWVLTRIVWGSNTKIKK